MSFLVTLGKLALDVDVPWLWIACGFFVGGMLVATARKTLGAFSQKAIEERLAGERRAKFVGYFDRLDEYGISLRIVDQTIRMGLVACSLLPFIRPTSAVGSIVSFFVLMAGVIVVVLVGLEFVPGVLSRISPERLALRLLPLLDGLYVIMGPSIRAYNALVAAGARAVGSQPPRTPQDLVEEEIIAAAQEGEREGVLETSERSMIEAIFRFKDRDASEVLTPRTEMVGIDVSTLAAKCVEIARDSGHSRLPVYEESKDSVLGILYVKDLLQFWENRSEEEFRLHDIIREAHFVPEDKKVSELFQEFRSQRFHIAIVLDEFGGTSGLITIEDIIEEILGEIEDEFDEQEERLVRLADGVIEVDARYSIVEFNHHLRAELPVVIPHDDGFDTLGGFLFTTMGRLPLPGETYDFGPIRFEVLSSDERVIRRLKVHIRESPSPKRKPASKGAKGAKGAT